MYYTNKSKNPTYKFNDFRKACRNRSNVFIFTPAQKDADKYFNLRTLKQILDFIYNNGLEKLIFLNTNAWNQNPNKNQQIMIDAYEFETGNKRGYIAFMYNNLTRKWSIKSLKLSENSNDQMFQAFKESGIIKKFNLEEIYE